MDPGFEHTILSGKMGEFLKINQKHSVPMFQTFILQITVVIITSEI